MWPDFSLKKKHFHQLRCKNQFKLLNLTILKHLLYQIRYILNLKINKFKQSIITKLFPFAVGLASLVQQWFWSMLEEEFRLQNTLESLWLECLYKKRIHTCSLHIIVSEKEQFNAENSVVLCLSSFSLLQQWERRCLKQNKLINRKDQMLAFAQRRFAVQSRPSRDCACLADGAEAQTLPLPCTTPALYGDAFTSTIWLD